MQAVKDAIIICRISKLGDTNTSSLDSQEFAIKRFLETNTISKIHSTYKNIGSAFNKPQTELKNLIKLSKNKIIFVYEPSRLSRNVCNFKEIWSICKTQNHNICIVNINKYFDCKNDIDYISLLKLIEIAENESRELGRRISRSIQYKKSKTLEWGYKLDNSGKKIENEIEVKISNLTNLLNTKGSSIDNIRKLMDEVSTNKDIEPFEIVQFNNSKTEYESLESDILPSSMSLQNIAETFNLYGVNKRKVGSKWKGDDINELIKSNSSKKQCIDDKLCDNLLNINIDNKVPESSESKLLPAVSLSPNIAWISIYYDPIIGLPSNIKLPEGMELPNIPTLLYIPKL